MLATWAKSPLSVPVLSQCLSQIYTKRRFSARSWEIPTYISRGHFESHRCLCIIKRDTPALSPRRIAVYATRWRPILVTAINIDQTQQWATGKRIDILYFPRTLTGCLRDRWSVTQTAIQGTNCRIHRFLRDSPHDEMLMDVNDTGGMFMYRSGNGNLIAFHGGEKKFSCFLSGRCWWNLNYLTVPGIISSGTPGLVVWNLNARCGNSLFENMSSHFTRKFDITN